MNTCPQCSEPMPDPVCKHCGFGKSSPAQVVRKIEAMLFTGTDQPTPSPATDVDEVAHKLAGACLNAPYEKRVEIAKQSLLTYGEKLKGENEEHKKQYEVMMLRSVGAMHIAEEVDHSLIPMMDAVLKLRREKDDLQSANEELKKQLQLAYHDLTCVDKALNEIQPRIQFLLSSAGRNWFYWQVENGEVTTVEKIDAAMGKQPAA